MNEALFEGVFYDLEDFHPDYSKAVLTSLPAAIIVPHARFDRIALLVEEAFGYASGLKPCLVAVLAPLHRSPLANDMGLTAITTPMRTISGRTFNVRIAKTDSPLVAERQSYFEEEPACEELYPAISRTFPEAEVLPLLCAGSTAGLGSLISQIMSQNPSTLFIISTNMIESGKLCAQPWIDALDCNWTIGSKIEGKVKHFTACSDMKKDGLSGIRLAQAQA